MGEETRTMTFDKLLMWAAARPTGAAARGGDASGGDANSLATSEALPPVLAASFEGGPPTPADLRRTAGTSCGCGDPARTDGAGPGVGPGSGSGGRAVSGSCGCGGPVSTGVGRATAGGCGCGPARSERARRRPPASEPRREPKGLARSGPGRGPEASPDPAAGDVERTMLGKNVDRRQALRMLFGGAATTAGAVSACSPVSLKSGDEKEAALLRWEEYFKTNFRLMTDEEKAETIGRLERLAEIEHGVDVHIEATDARPKVLYGYAFNISKCKGYRNCVDACVRENNQDRRTDMQYIRIFEIENGSMRLEDGTAEYQHEVPAEGHFYLGTQCFQCENPPCVDVCPVGATWKEPDGITVIDYDWCIGCRYCEAACPYWARRFNWSPPEVPAAEMNPNQHYLGNRMRKKGVMEKCTFCIQRTRTGRLPACAEACPTGARVFGNLLDPDSEIRWVLENKKVFRMKEELGTEPKFWYFMD